MRRCRVGAVLILAVMLPFVARAQASSAVGTVIAFDAELAKPASKAHVPMKAGGVEWTCTTTRCSGRGPGKDPVSTCKALVGQVGALKSFNAAGRAVDLHACGAVTTVITPAPINRSVPVSTAKPVGVAAAAPAAAAASAPSKKTSAPSGGLTWTASAMTLTGTGSGGPPSTFKPIAWDAGAMTLTGTGAAPVVHATALTWTADTMKLTGHP